jgi:hypothetical protein
MVSLDDQRTKHTALAATLVVAGVVLKNSAEQMPNLKESTKLTIELVGALSFMAGWIYMAIALSNGRKDKLKYVFPCLVIFGTANLLKTVKNKDVKMVLAAMFALSWIVLGVLVGDHLQDKRRYFGLIASALVIVSMMGILPMQRQMGVVDGPGMVMFTLAWVVIVMVNSSV